MNKKLYFSLCVSLLCLSFAFGCILLIFEINNIKNENPTKEYDEKISPKKISAVKNDIEYYLVINENDIVKVYSVYENGERRAEAVLDEINVNTMRKTDRETFEKGIVIKSREDLICLIEDYTS